jgi:hypothetical protein
VAGCAGRGEKERKKKEDLLAESADQNCMLYLNKYLKEKIYDDYDVVVRPS